MSEEHIYAPWNQDQIASLNAYQKSCCMHPFTCGNNRGDQAHREYAAKQEDIDWGILTATENGWVCPVCGYTQNWAHTFMGNWAWLPHALITAQYTQDQEWWSANVPQDKL